RDDASVEREAVATTLFDTLLPESGRYSLVATGVGEGEQFHLALGGVGENLALPPIRLYHSETGEVETLPFSGGWPQFTPDGAALLLQREETVEVAPEDFRTRYQTWLRPLDPPGSEARPFYDGLLDIAAWSPDGSLLAAWSPDGRSLLLLDGRSGALVQPWRSEQERGPLHWSPDGSALLVKSGLPPAEQFRLIPVRP
ncbi:MAG: hypothetical protein ACRDIB_14770, partial [Ardenticatenaceae bacterium]